MIEKMRNRYVDSLPAILAVACLAGCLYFWFQLSGREYGMFYGVFADPPSNGLSPVGPNYFASINTWYFVISLCLMVYVMFGRIGKARTAFAIRIVAICVATFPLFTMLDFKYAGLPYRRPDWWYQTSFYFDVFTAAAILGIIGIEIFRLRQDREQ